MRDDTLSIFVNTCSWSLAIVLGSSAAGCYQTEFETGEQEATWGAADESGRPGDPSREASEDIDCDTNADCGMGEACEDGVCQMARCGDPYTSVPPLKTGTRFFVDQELLVADKSLAVTGLEVDGKGAMATASWNVGAQVVDLATGRFTEQAAEATVVVRVGVKTVALAHAPEIAATLSHTPVAVAAGDVDGDDRDEAVVLGPQSASVCDLASGKCDDEFPLEGDGIDITLGDIDGDGHDEAVVLLGQGDSRLLVALPLDESDASASDLVTSVDERVSRIDAGDFDGDGIEEVAAMAEDSLFGFKAAQLQLFRATGDGFDLASAQDIDKTSIDVAAGDIDMDNRDELVILREANIAELMRPSQKTLALLPSGVQPLPSVAGATRVAMGDFDGDSPRARLLNDFGELVPGPVAPLMAMHFPPFDAGRSVGVGSGSIGNSESVAQTWADTVSISAKAAIGVNIGLPHGLGASLTATLGKDISRTASFRSGYSFGARVSAAPTPDMQGEDHGLVLLTCACYHVYRYELEDPKQRLGAREREPFVVVLPVGATVTAWSAKRYNLMANAVGGLPPMRVPYIVGDPSSYPSGPQHVDGRPIAAQDMLFPEVPSLLVSDIGDVGWWLVADENMANKEATRLAWDVTGSLNVGPFSFRGTAATSTTATYTLTVGESASFGGAVPPIPDNPTTPEDEYEAHAFSFAPYVYRERYTDANGQEAGYYVMSYAVGEARQ